MSSRTLGRERRAASGKHVEPRCLLCGEPSDNSRRGLDIRERDPASHVRAALDALPQDTETTMHDLRDGRLRGQMFRGRGLVPRRRRAADGAQDDDQGVAALEWLLITAGVAALTAFFVLLIQSTVDDTGNQISDSNPRRQAAHAMALTVEDGAKSASGEAFDTWDEWEMHFGAKCRSISIIYADADVEVIANQFKRASSGRSRFDDVEAGYAAAGDRGEPTSIKAQVNCAVN